METLHVNDNGHTHAESPYIASIYDACSEQARGLINTLSFQHDIPYTDVHQYQYPTVLLVLEPTVPSQVLFSIDLVLVEFVVEARHNYVCNNINWSQWGHRTLAS